ncbi:hypothetical protein J3R30DRAFT_3425530 [Lentinula aciculospora]|uniref:Transmembrane protein n=1 Tax=Lentinula aciculospora TaxID=153920 RepID=A0A9W9DYA3_9AGAR|nr:hypothetical protein J3R30DRAFT_3425530 [Lentinula aciculospora]
MSIVVGRADEKEMSDSQSTISQSIHRSNEPSFPWFGVSLGAAIAAALAVPSVLYLKRKNNIKLSTRPVTRRRQTPMNASLKSLASKRISSSNAAHSSAKMNVRISPLNNIPESPPVDVESKSEFNPALYTIGAFGIATLLVSVGAVASIWTVKTAMGVENTKEFARKMRRLVLLHMPILSVRIHRALENDEDDGGRENTADWNWEDGERRLKDAFEKDGIVAWAEVVLKEIQAEERLERLRRKELDVAHEGKHEV